jgi:hypothetical protein
MSCLLRRKYAIKPVTSQDHSSHTAVLPGSQQWLTICKRPGRVSPGLGAIDKQIILEINFALSHAVI